MIHKMLRKTGKEREIEREKRVEGSEKKGIRWKKRMKIDGNTEKGEKREVGIRNSTK